MKFVKNYRVIVIIICIVLSLLPFIWFKPGEMDLGGDSSRLFFYDPVNFLWNNGLFYILPWGIGMAESYLFYLPFVVFILILKSILQSSYVVISLFSALKLVVGFLAMYGILKILISKKDIHEPSSKLVEVSSILGGLFYILNPQIIKNDSWVTPINSHHEIFLNPLIFYLLLRFFLSNKYGYLLLALLISFIFSPNFAWGAIYSFSAFYPLALIFLSLYVVFIQKKQMPWKGIIIGLLLFLGLHAFHLIPTVVDLFTPGTNLNTRTLSEENRSLQLNHFYGVIGYAKASINMLSVAPIKEFAWTSMLIPIIVIGGFLFNKEKRKTILLTGIFFLITFFFLTANITHFSVKFYEKLFYIPGFAMFRDFTYVWRFVFAFFYALLFGQALFFIFSQIKKSYVKFLFPLLAAFVMLNAWPFINGDLVTKGEFSTHAKSGIVMDPQFEASLSFLRSQKEDTKVLTLPFNDGYMQPLIGTNNAWYIGISMISSLTGKKDFAGYQIMSPFPDLFLNLAKDKDFESLKRLLGLLNIRYVFLNQESKLYESAFYGWLFSHVNQYLPRDQNEYIEFVKQLTNEKIFERGSYSVYTVDDNAYLPHFYIAKGISMYEDTVDDWYGKTLSFFVDQKNDEVRTAFIYKDVCKNVFTEKECNSSRVDMENAMPKIQFEKINPTKYKIKVSGVQGPYMLVFSEAFYKNWKVFLSPMVSLQENTPLRTYFDGDIKENSSKNIFLDSKTFETFGMKSVADGNDHVLANGYANAWYITPEDVGNKGDYELVVEMVGQRVFYISLGISLLVFIFCLGWGLKPFAKNLVF